MNHSFICDGLLDYPHYSPIRKLVFISRKQSGFSQIGCLDEQGIISVWNIIEVLSFADQEEELNLSLGAKFKMSLNYSDNLTLYQNVLDPFQMEDIS